jgi:hypothetical protein
VKEGLLTIRLGSDANSRMLVTDWHLASPGALCFTELVLVYGIASSVSRDVDDFYPTRAEAEATLAEILADEPELEGALWVEPVELDLSPN